MDQQTEPTESDKIQCDITGQWVEPDDVVELMGYTGCAEGKAILLERRKSREAEAWRDDDLVVIEREGDLPDRCIKCNVPTDGRWLKRELRAGNELAQKTATVRVSLCREHWKHFRRRTLVLRFFLVGAFCGLVTCFWLGVNDLAIICMLSLILIALIDGHLRSRIISAVNIDKSHVWLGGAGKEFLAELPEWRSQSGNVD